MKRILVIGAGVVLIVTTFFLVSKRPPLNSNTDLFSAHFDLPPPALERAAIVQSEIWYEAMMAYQNQDFKRTIALLSITIDQPDFPFTERGKLYLGICYLITNELEKAVNLFGQIDAEGSYIQGAEWYSALAYLKMDNVEKTKQAFEQIANQSWHFKQKEALEILDKL